MTETVAYPGVPGAFAEEACDRFLSELGTMGLPSFDDVALEVARGHCAYGMLPLHNSVAGPVPGIEDLIARLDLAVVATHHMPVRQHLMAKPGAKLAAIRRAVSHPMALAQCSSSLDKLGLAVEQASNTAAAARALAKSDDYETAVVGSARAAEIWGLEILMSDIHDRPDNFTTFCVVARQQDGRR